MAKIWIVSELYYPEETSTGHYMTHIAEALATYNEVAVLCTQPTYSRRGQIAPPKEIRNKVEIRRCYSTRLNKNHLFSRIVNLATTCVSIFASSIFLIKENDIIIVVTNPPLLPIFLAIVSRIRNAPYYLKVDDVYPDVLVAAGVIKQGSIISRIWHNITKAVILNARQNIVLGEDMKLLLQCSYKASNISVIRNWADDDQIKPLNKGATLLGKQLKLDQTFVVQCAGNLGPIQGLGTVVKAARTLRDNPLIHFTFLGSGRDEALLKKQATGLENITFLGQRHREEQCDFLNACDIAIVSLIKEMRGISVPSRAYNVLAAGKPIIAIMEASCEIACMVKSHHLGWIVAPGDVEGLTTAVIQASESPNLCKEMGRRSRHLAETIFSRRQVLLSYCNIVMETSNDA